MENDLKTEILFLIQQAEAAREWALNTKDSGGYPYISGYATAALRQIRELVKEA